MLIVMSRRRAGSIGSMVCHLENQVGSSSRQWQYQYCFELLRKKGFHFLFDSNSAITANCFCQLFTSYH